MLLLPLYLTHLGGSRAEIGVIMSIAHLAGLLTRPIVGWSLDVVGRKKSLLFGSALTVFSLLCVYWITEIGPIAYAVRILFGIGEGFLFTGYFAFAADMIPKSRRTEGLALFGVAGLLPLLVNPIADLTGFGGGGLRLFLTGVSLFVALSFLLILTLPDAPPQTNKTPLTLKAVSNALLAPALMPIWVGTIAFSGGVAIFMTFVSVIGESRGISVPTAPWFTYVGGALLARLVGAKIPERVGPHRLVAPTLVLYSFALLICASAHHLPSLLLAGAFAGIAHGYCFPVLTGLVISAVDDRFRGSALALFTGLWGVTAVLFAPTGGLIADRWGDDVMLWTMSGLILAVAVTLTPKRFVDAQPLTT